ncbi:hypothetical protein B0H10DRAFT_1942558 [Mycena sp. CBHHK59/15]|nr:hypothetical protein B0H10DRAFT_1942558 [Mycena sp. CBHHK59/15]
MLHRLKNLLGFGPSPPDISLSPTPSIPPQIGPPPLPGNKPLPPALVVTGAAFPQYTGMHTNPAQTGPNLNTAIWTPFWPPNPGSVPLSHVPAHMPAYFQPYPYFPPLQQILQLSSPTILPTQMQQSRQSLSVQNGSSNPQAQLPLATTQSNMPFPTINPPTLIDSPSYQWPDGNVRLECTFGLEPSGWDDEGWKWRSSGSCKTGVQEGAYKAFFTADLMVYQVIFFVPRPRRELATNSLPKLAIYVARHWYTDDEGPCKAVRHHVGRHGHARPPLWQLAEHELKALDLQVRQNPQATAQQLRAGAGPSQITLGDINPILLDSQKARNKVEKSKVQQQLIAPASGRNSGFQLLDSFSALKDSFETPWIVKAELLDRQYICMQTPFMRDALLRDSVQSWHDENLEAESGRHGVLTDGTHDFFNQGILLTSLVFSHVILRWVAVLYTWIRKQNEEHHVPHISQLVHGIGEACTRGLGYTFDDRLFSAILDFSNAQRNGFIEAFVEYIILEGTSTTPVEFLRAVTDIYREFSEIRPWLTWWILPGNGGMIFPAMQRTPAELRAKLPSSTNVTESAHNLLYRAAGQHHDIWEGVRRLYRVQRETEMLYEAVMAGDVQARFQGSKPQHMSRITWHENDGRAPDTRSRLAAVERLEADLASKKSALTEEECFVAVNSSQASKVPPTKSQISIEIQLLQSYKWDANSCFIDAPMEAFFRAFVPMSDAVRAQFLRRIRTEGVKTGLQDVMEHFWLRGLLSGAISSKDHRNNQSTCARLVTALDAGQKNVKRLLHKKWDGGEFTPGMPGCTRTWPSQMIMYMVHYVCSSSHTTSKVHNEICLETLIHGDDLRLVQHLDLERPLLEEYLMHRIPHEQYGSSRSISYAPIHAVEPTISCSNPSCQGSDATVALLSTEWPLFLRVVPIWTSRIPAEDSTTLDLYCPLTMNLGSDVEYELISRVIYLGNMHDGSVGHFITQTRVTSKPVAEIQQALERIPFNNPRDRATSVVESDEEMEICKRLVPQDDDEIDRMIGDTLDLPHNKESKSLYCTNLYGSNVTHNAAPKMLPNFQGVTRNGALVATL